MLAASPDDRKALAHFASRAIAVKDSGAAQREIERLAELGTNDPGIYLALAELREKANDPRATDAYARAARLAAKDADIQLYINR